MPIRSSLAAVLALLVAIAGHAQCAELSVTVLDAGKRPIADVVVIARAEGRTPLLPATKESIDQIDQEFIPFVKVVTVGSAVQFPNKDSVRHQVYSFSPAKKFELPLYAGTPSEPVVFDRPGIVTLGCNIHDWMLAYVYVADTPYFAVTASSGRAVLQALPPGEYVVQIWHPRMEGTEKNSAQRLTVGEGAAVSATWTLKLNADLRPRRAPVPGGGGYR
jgi:plastocyanin